MYSEQLRYFSLAYHTRSYSAAAKRVPISPQGLTKALHSLEHELGVRLFSRGEGNTLIPTAQAQELIRFIETWDAGLRSLHESFDRIDAQQRHEIRLGASLGIIGGLGDEFLPGFYEENPPVSVRYSETNDALCDASLRDGETDMAFTLAPFDSGFVTTELGQFQICLWTHDDNPLSLCSTISVEDLEGQSIAYPGRGFKCFEHLVSACREQTVRLGSIYEMSELFRIYGFVCANKGLGFTVDIGATLPVFNSNGHVHAIPLEGATWRYGLSYLPLHQLTEYEQRFYDYCLTYASVSGLH